MGDSPSENSSISLVNVGELVTALGKDGTSLSVPVPFQNKIVLLENVRIAGTTHISNIDTIVEDLEDGTELRLEREPDNNADHWAIRIFAKAARIGYVPADCNEILARLMDGGKALSAKLIGREKIGNWHKLYMEVSLDD